jgi:GAF domain-containing protein
MDIATDSRCTWAECKRSGTKSFAVLPLKTGDEVIGVLGLASAAPRDFKVQSTFLETLAAQAAAGIQNALLH